MGCPFCEIDEKRMKVLEKGKLSFVCFSNPRLVKGHLLVIPNRHVEHISELSEEEILDIFEKLKFYQKLILKRVSAGCDIKQNYRPFLKQNDFKVDHVHFHLLPRNFNDEIYEKVMSHQGQLWEFIESKDLDKLLEVFGG